MILVLDFGSQYTQLIAKRLRKLGFKAEVVPGVMTAAELRKYPEPVAGLVLSGSPSSVGVDLHPDEKLLDLNLPILGLCFGYHFLAAKLGGKVEKQTKREYGASRVKRTEAGRKDPLTADYIDEATAWMSHGDSVTRLPDGAVLLMTSAGASHATSGSSEIAAFSVPKRRFWGLQFHPEVVHSEKGEILFKSFAERICGLKPDWNLKGQLDEVLAELREELKDVNEVVCAVSGGVDSTVLAVLLSQVVKVRALFVDHGFLRAYDLPDLRVVFSRYPNIELEVIDARERFWKVLEGVSDPELKRKTIGRLFIETFRDAADPKRHPFLGQGTIYSDVIESAGNKLGPSQLIKSHHNVGGLPEDMPFNLIEPLRRFFKDEVRELGVMLGIERSALERHPFPGPGLAIRCIGGLKPERINVLRRADAVFREELLARKLYEKTWQAFVVLLPIQAVGVMGDGRSYESVAAIRCVDSVDAMTAEASELPWKDLKGIASRIVNEVRGINRVVFDLTSKPPGTIEWE